jgi:hypothetical protein
MNEAEKRAFINDIIRLRGGARQQKAGSAGIADSQDHSTIKKILLIDRGELVPAAEELRNVMAASGQFYERGTPVWIAKRKGDKLPFASPLTKNSVVRASDKLCVPTTKNGEKTTLPNRVADIYLDMVGEWQLPPLRAISTAPVLLDDGSIRDGDGYDPDTSLYLHNVPKLAVPAKPTKEDAEHALLRLRRAFATFPFADAAMTVGADGTKQVDHKQAMGRDESAFLNGLLTAICRQSLPLAPGLLVDAPTHSGAGTGKGLAMRAISATAYGCAPYAFTRGDGWQETEKRLVAAVIEARPMVFLDNANLTMLRSDTLASFITEQVCAVRPLGRSQMVELEIGSFFGVTGNGLSPSEDLIRRFLNSRFDARMENPELRNFAPGFLLDVERNRTELLIAALAVWRWGRQQADANLTRGKPLGSFEVWAKWVRDPLLTLGCPDPVERLKEIKARDPSRQRAAEIFTTWWEHHQDNPIKVSALDPKVIEIIDPGQKKHSLNWQAAQVSQLVGTRQSGFVLEIFGPPGAGKRGTEYRLQMTDEHDGLTPEAPKPPAPPASSDDGEENTVRLEGYGNGRAVDHPQGHSPGNGKPDQSPANSNAGTAGGAGGLDRSNDGFSNCGTDAEDDGDLTIPPILDRRGEPLCHQCGRPGGTIWDYDDQKVRLHSHCESAWIDARRNSAGTRT